MLEAILKDVIRERGSMRLDEYMATCLYDEKHGYYRTRDPLGAAGDFTTSPEISQMFGEMMGAWLMMQWQAMGSPEDTILVELGPGRGTLMADILRTIGQSLPQMLEAITVHLVEINPALKAKQAEALKASGIKAQWHEDVSQLPSLPMLLVANEFFDALPIRQFRKTEGRWQEKFVGLENNTLTWVWKATSKAPACDAATTIVETSPASVAIMRQLAQHIAEHNGAALLIDYGYREGHGDSFQALKSHRYTDPLSQPGEADLTAHVDFAALKTAAQEGGAKAYGAVLQGDFLQSLHIQLRAGILCKNATPPQQEKILTDVHRLTAQEGMGSLFKCLAVLHSSLPKPEGF